MGMDGSGGGDQRIVVVLGMHRSGTSCLTGILESAGVDLGEVSRRNPFNPRGNLESKRVIDLHDALLRFNGGSWDAPPAGVVWPEALKKERDVIIHEKRGSRCWGLKDPRMLLTLEGWLEVLPAKNTSLVATFRHPHSVARSLHARNGIPLEKALSLWKIYNEKLLARHAASGFPVICFDYPAGDYAKQVRKLLDLWALPGSGRALDFYDNELRHHGGQNAALPGDIRALYDRLSVIAL